MRSERYSGTAKPLIEMVLFLILATAGVFAWSSMSEASESDFTAESPSCDNCYRYFEPTERVWVGRVDVLFNPENAENLGEWNVRRSIERAIDLIQVYIYLDMGLQGDTTIVPVDSYDPARQNTIIFNMEDVGYPTLGYAYLLWGWDGSSRLNQARASLLPTMRRSCLDGVVLHELLHTLYIDHSDKTASIMSATPYRSCEYQATLRLDDIEALQSLYPPKPNRQGTISSFDGTIACSYSPVLVYGSTSETGVELCGTVTSVTIENE